MAVVEMAIELRSGKRASGESRAGASFFNGQPRVRTRHPAANGIVSRHSEASRRVSGRVVSRTLLSEYHRTGDLRARERLIRQYLPLVRRLARAYTGRGESFEDLVQVGSIGLINSIDRFELDRGVDLTAYAIPSIVGEMKRHLRDRAWPIRIPRRLQELSVSIKVDAAELAAELERPATVAEIAQEAGVRQDDVVEALACGRSHQPVSLSAADGNGDGVLDWNCAVEGGYEAGEDRATLARGFRVLDERERRLLHLAFFKGMSQSQIAREVGISQIHVSRLTRRALDKLRAEIGPD
jgi:RNA polymerase sigma-B factor